MDERSLYGNASANEIKISENDKGVLILLSTLVGSLGVDRFYRGQIGLGIVKFLTFGGCGIWALIDSIIYMLGEPPRDSDGFWILDKKTLEYSRSGRADISAKDKGVLQLLSTLLGIFGADRFYRGQIGLGIAKLLTIGGLGIWALIDCIIYMVGELPLDSEGKPIADRRTLEILR